VTHSLMTGSQAATSRRIISMGVAIAIPIDSEWTLVTFDPGGSVDSE